MATTGLDTFDRTIHQTHVWLNQISEALHCDRQRSWHALRAVLHALRDRLVPGEAAKLASELPLLIRGLYYEGYKPDTTPTAIRKREEFLEDVRARHALDVPDVEEMVTCVFEVLSEHVSRGEIEKVRHALPEELRELWAAPV